MSPALEQFSRQYLQDFKKPELLEQAFIHRSFLNENHGKGLEHNERLEFFGDAVLELVVTEHLYNTYPNPEGELTNWRSATVKGEELARVARKLKMGELLQMSRGEEKSGGRDRGLLLANAFEALIGAIYLDQGYDAAKKFIKDQLIVGIPDIIEQQLYLDPKSHLQELCQEKLSLTPSYKILYESGPDHSKKFTSGVYAGSDLIANGDGPSKQRAEQNAAANALKAWDEFVAKK